MPSKTLKKQNVINLQKNQKWLTYEKNTGNEQPYHLRISGMEIEMTFTFFFLQ